MFDCLTTLCTWLCGYIYKCRLCLPKILLAILLLFSKPSLRALASCWVEGSGALFLGIMHSNNSPSSMSSSKSGCFLAKAILCKTKQANIILKKRCSRLLLIKQKRLWNFRTCMYVEVGLLSRHVNNGICVSRLQKLFQLHIEFFCETD